MEKSGWSMTRWLLLGQIMGELSLCHHSSKICQWYHEILSISCNIDPTVPIPLFFLRHYANYSTDSFFLTIKTLFSTDSLADEHGSFLNSSIKQNPSMYCILLEETRKIYEKAHPSPRELPQGKNESGKPSFVARK
eukprot:CAMPEP_0201508176 /NCGR_PEP_ID=MMETSP0161_2-20130828/1614_1 /ASSEMBLY_ACC=CAM_ASM_000251 /TAXON_ID=180227 /ORGANISM="Neoparamoeba aestuarina, Strain SoJaBio B1-5/56/2" /LENGTH=135 /DNA_ID=CAMNT_0047902749 /DNA_START=1070 /DNA_END=1477 /DNA_ORIENTATION=-